MTKQEFLTHLRRLLSELPEKETEERLTFFAEMIDDRMEDGLSEEEAVCGIGSVEDAARHVMDGPTAVLQKEKTVPQRKRNTLTTVLAVIGSPVWLSLLIAAFAVLIALFAALWATVISLWAAQIAIALCGPACAAAGIVLIAKGSALTGIAVIGAGLVCAGVSLFLFTGLKAVTKGAIQLTGSIAVRIGNRIRRREKAS